MATSNSSYLDLRTVHNYLIYCVGIAVESVAPLLLMVVGFCLCLLGMWLFD